jgi:hypothetical protein
MEHRADSATPGGHATVHRTIPVSAPESPVAALADIEAWKARKTYPSMLFAGGPVFGAARERKDGGWALLPHFNGLAPQDARDGLGAYFRTCAGERRAGGDARSADDYAAAGDRLDWEALDELTAGGRRYRVVRAERFIRMGPDGPEPPRVTDPDPGEPGECEGVDPAAGLVVDPYDATGVRDGVFKAELLAALRKHGAVPGGVREESRAAALTHPGGVLLPATFVIAERDGDRWRPGSSGTAPTPQSARDALAMQLRVMLPWQRDLTDEQRAVYSRAADRLDADRCDELAVAGRHFRIVRVERLLRVGPDGPEGPRPSDPDPVPPLMVQDRELREQGRAPEEDDPADEPDERTLRFLRLFDEERRRRQSLRGS